MKGFVINIEKVTLANTYFREVLYTTKNSQLVVMTLEAGEDIGGEVHKEHDQFIRVEEGEGVVILNGEQTSIKDGTAIVIPAGTLHNLVNTGSSKLKLYTLYCPPEHKDKVVHKTKADALLDEEHFDGVTSE